MGFYREISNSEHAAKDTALINRMQNNDNHSVAGVLLATNAGNILDAGLSIFGKLTARNEVPAEENPQSVDDRKTSLSEFNDLRRNFLSNPTKANALALQDFYLENSSDSTIHNGYRYIKDKVEEYIKKSA